MPVSTPAIPDGGEPTPTEPRDGVVSIVEYVDFSCPICKQFEEEFGDYITGLVESGEATLEVHPVAILDPRFTGPEFSTRVNNAGACVADAHPESFLDVMAAMFANQPEEGTAGLTDEELIDIVHSAGVEDDAVDACIDGRRLPGLADGGDEPRDGQPRPRRPERLRHADPDRRRRAVGRHRDVVHGLRRLEAGRLRAAVLLLLRRRGCAQVYESVETIWSYP